MVQTLFAGIVPPVSLTLALPTASAAPALSVNVPPQLFVVVVLNSVMFPGAPPAVLGNVSVNVAAVIALAVGFDNVMVSVDDAFGATVPGVNDLLTDGGGVTVMLWLPAVLMPALLLVTAPTGMVLV